MLFIKKLKLSWGVTCAIFPPFIPKYLNFSTKKGSKQRVQQMADTGVIAHGISVRANVSCLLHAILQRHNRCQITINSTKNLNTQVWEKISTSEKTQGLPSPRVKQVAQVCYRLKTRGRRGSQKRVCISSQFWLQKNCEVILYLGLKLIKSDLFSTLAPQLRFSFCCHGTQWEDCPQQ